MNIKKTSFMSGNSGVLSSFLIVIIMLPWFRGGEVNWQYKIFESTLFLIFAYLTMKAVKTNSIILLLKPLNKFKLPILLLLSFCLYSFIQAIDLNNIFHQKTNNSLFIEKQLSSLSESPEHSFNEALKQLSYLCVFILTILLITTKKRVLTIITVIFTISALTAVYALINYYTKGGFLYIETLPPWHASNYKTIHGPLSYKNHYASFLILTIPLGLGLLLSNKLPRTRSNTALVLNFILSKNFILVVTSLFMIMVLIFNTSRGGLFSFFLGLTITTTYLLYTKKIKPQNIYKKFSGLFLIIIIIIFSGLSDRLFERINNYGENGRDILRTTALKIAIDNPITGTGAGTYPAIQHKYKPETLNGNKMWQHVHNDYLELLSNQGVIGLLLLGSAIYILIFSLIKGIKYNNNSLLGIQASCLCSVLCVLIHSLMDFNFQLPVINIYFCIILAVGLRISSIKKHK